MKFQVPAFLEEVKSPFEGEAALHAEFPGAVIIGVDEVGRGPLAGPVVAAAAVLKPGTELCGLNDSKKLSRGKREAIFESVKAACECYAIASASVREIDELNILEADFLAMRRALLALGAPLPECPEPELPVEARGKIPEGKFLVVVDGNLKIRGVDPAVQIPVVKGDSRVASVSAASVLAKVFRDRFMASLALEFPQYGFEQNAGYGTKQHLEALRKFGWTSVHRKSFSPKALQEDETEQTSLFTALEPAP